MSNGFVHSIPVPRLYKTAAKTVRQVTEEGASLKQLIYEKKHPNLKGVYALATTTLHNSGKLNEIIRKTQLLFKEPRFDPWLARVLITELIWGKGVLKNESKPIQTILTYENEIRQHLQSSTPESASEEPKKKEKSRYIRINTLVKSVEDAIEGFKWDGYELLPRSKTYEEFLETVRNLGNWPYPVFIQDFHVEELFAFPAGTHFYDHPGYKSGAIILQDKASCLPAYLLNPKPGSVVLDMCAAPGMKTTHLAAILQNRGKVISVERNMRRYQVLCEMVNHANTECVQTFNRDALTLSPEECEDVQYILVDPSCSGSGMDRPEFENSQGKCAPGRLKRLQSFQVLLLRHALLNFPTVKRVVYSTCSMYPEENEMVVDEILRDIGKSYELVSARKLLENHWINFSSKDYECGENCLYARPNIDHSNGFFVAVFERNPDVPLPDSHKKRKMIENSVDNSVKGADETRKDKKGKKRKNRGDSETKSDYMKSNIDEDLKEVRISDELSEGIIKKRKKTRGKDERGIEINSLDEGNNLSNNGETEKRKKKKKRKQEKESVECDFNSDAPEEIYEMSETPPKTKKKKKRKSDVSSSQ
ncbi:probable 28S rRNA (cytosine-C(5))-methyltransferase [Fopius arisanus]|uniref:Probable 28S rRNA (Cytosine-C(5))-methyltransferase n=1 Tax=Fopius arisanus TaxID=64838 RepID=A0A9R1T0R6_9HYME|nr:PREDICTED: probable 28S rRNA (cytosine-C(5))-methyltransferase [Fopius arisanus]